MSGRVRSSRSETRQVAALPWREGDEGRQILMITSRETRRWVIPKGGRMRGKTDPQAAAIEAMEEAGVQGKVEETPLGAFRYAKRLKNGEDRACVVAVYPLRVLIQLGAWPEAHQRERRWMTPDEAAASVDEPDLARLISAFGVARIED
jgi:8-oxo-dGTP pyrophosphatase MutT (NUDIX family)